MRAARFGARLVLRPFEGQEDAAPQCRRIVERLQSWCECRPVVVAEIRMRRSGPQDQVVVVEESLRELQTSRRQVRARDLREHDLGVELAAQYRANGCTDVGRRQGCGRDLVEERLEDMVIAAIDDGDVDGGMGKRLGRRQAGEPAADDEHPRAAARSSRPARRTLDGGGGHCSEGCSVHEVTSSLPKTKEVCPTAQRSRSRRNAGPDFVVGASSFEMRDVLVARFRLGLE
jgi:hypothetical protein